MRLILCTVVVALAAPCAAAEPEESPYSATAAIGQTHDNNLFRAAPGQEQADRYISSSIAASADQRWGRQRLQARALVSNNRYHLHDELDNTAYDGRLAWAGSTEGDISWTLSQEGARQLASYVTVLDPTFHGANTQTIDQTQAGLQLGLQAEWVANAALSRRRVDHTAPAFERDRVRLDSAGLGLQWNPLGPLSASIGPRWSRGRVPLASDGVDRSFRRTDIDFGLSWVVTGQSVLHARLSGTRQRPDLSGQADFSGTTGQLDAQWTVSGRTRLSLALSRDTGSETAFFAPPGPGQALGGNGDDSQLTTALAAHAEHDLTGKISLSGDLQFAQRALAAGGVQGGSVVALSGSDRSTLVRLGLRYTPTRSVLLGCDATRERRSTSGGLSAAYRVNVMACNAALTLRWS